MQTSAVNHSELLNDEINLKTMCLFLINHVERRS